MKKGGKKQREREKEGGREGIVTLPREGGCGGNTVNSLFQSALFLLQKIQGEIIFVTSLGIYQTVGLVWHTIHIIWNRVLLPAHPYYISTDAFRDKTGMEMRRKRREGRRRNRAGEGGEGKETIVDVHVPALCLACYSISPSISPHIHSANCKVGMNSAI